MKTINPIIIVCFLCAFSCNENYFPTIDIQKNETIGKTKEQCSIVYANGKTKSKLFANIKSRGGFSVKFSKKSFAVELEKKYSLNNLPKDDDWILNANYIDKTFMRHKISYDLFKEMKTKNEASNSSYVNLSVNGLYAGLYVVMEEINASKLGLNKNDTMSMVFKDPPVFRKKKLSGDEVHEKLNYYQQKYPNIDVCDKSYYMLEFERFLFKSKDKEFLNKVSNWVDIENVIDWHILLLLSNNSDGILKNFYLYKKDKDTPFRFAIWDYDHSFGRDGDNEYNLMDRELDCSRSILLDRLCSIDKSNYLMKVKQRWFELRELNIISKKNFQKHINDNNKIIRNEVKRNFNKWPTNGEWYYDDNSYEQELDLMKKFISIRIKQLDNYFNSL